MRNHNWIYHNFQGIKFSDEYTAEIGLAFKGGTELKFYRDCKCYENFTVDADGVTGDLITSGAPSGIGATFLRPVSNSDILDSSFDPAASYGDESFRVAIYLTEVEPATETNTTVSIPFIIFYRESTNSFLPYYTTVDNANSVTKLINDTTKVVSKNLNNGTETLQDYNTYNMSGNPGDYNINANYINNDIFREFILSTNIPVFDTQAHAEAYLRDPDTIVGIINNFADPSEEYEEARKYRYINNIYGHNSNNVTQYTGYRNYRFYGGDGKICLVRTTATTASPFTVKLYHYESYTVKSAGVYDTDDEDYTVISNPELKYLHTSIQFADNNYYTKFKFNTDLLIFSSEAQADLWIDDVIDARQAENFNQVSRVYDNIVDPGYGNTDPGYDNGTNGQSYVHGPRMWVMSSLQLGAFFDDIFNPLEIQNLLDGTKLFGSSEIQAIQGVTYLPLDIDDVATVYSTAQAIKIGSYTCPTATGRYVQNNNKMLNCGSVFIAPVYNDMRDYHIKLFIQLPYCGTHELNISKFLGRNLEVYYAVDITSGACTAHVLADGISYGDSFDGYMASQRPMTALDQTAWLNSVMGSVSSIVNREAGLISQAKSAYAGVATGKAKQVANGGSSFSGLSTSFGAISDLYNLGQAVKDVPMTTRGGFSGCLGFFGNQQIHIITVQSKTVKPLMEQQIVGYPSHVSQRIGNFSGYLKTSAIQLTNFSGTAQELADVQNALSKGIYL